MHGVDINDLVVYRRNVTSPGSTAVPLDVELSRLHGPWSVETTSQTNPFDSDEDWWNLMRVQFDTHEDFHVGF